MYLVLFKVTYSQATYFFTLPVRRNNSFADHFLLNKSYMKLENDGPKGLRATRFKTCPLSTRERDCLRLVEKAKAPVMESQAARGSL